MVKVRVASLLLLALVVGACTPSRGPAPTSSTIEVSSTFQTTTPTLPETPDFDEFVESSFRLITLREPETVTALGLSKEYETRDDQLNDMSQAFASETNRLVEQTLDRLEEFDAESLTFRQTITQDAYAWYLEQLLSAYEFRLEEWPVHFLLNSYNQALIGLFTEVHPLNNRNQIDDYLARIGSVPAQVDEIIVQMEDSVSAGILPPAYVVDITINQLEGDIAGGNATSMGIYRSFNSRIGLLGLNTATVGGYQDELTAKLEDSFIPAWQGLIDYLRDIEGQADNNISLQRLPRGANYYESLLAFHTSTELSAGEIHAIGTEQVDRIKAEMLALGDAVGYDASSVGRLREEIAEAGGFLSGEEIVATYEELIATADEAFAPYFNAAPATSLEVVNDPAPIAFYVSPAVDGSRPGSFHAGTGGGAVPIYTMRSLAYHEAVPGHHFQISIAQESDLPPPQMLIPNTGHVEGWALYAERLAADIGLYVGDPIGDFGRLDFELLRAARLVVDTGIHDLGWSRDEAIDRMTQIMETDRYNGEVDRYALYPGQATAYMVGMLEILQMRSEYGTDLGEPDSFAAFHDLMIGEGNLPLTVLRSLVSNGDAD